MDEREDNEDVMNYKVEDCVKLCNHEKRYKKKTYTGKESVRNTCSNDESYFRL